MFKKLVLCILPVFLLLSACSAPTAAPQAARPAPATETAGVKVSQASDLLGAWTITAAGGGQTDWYFQKDGTYRLGIHRLDKINKGSGQYGVENGEFWIKDDFCPTPGRYTVVRNGSGATSSLDFTVIEDTCPARVNFLNGHQAVWTGSEPNS